MDHERLSPLSRDGGGCWSPIWNWNTDIGGSGMREAEGLEPPTSGSRVPSLPPRKVGKFRRKLRSVK
jgi:hypothetical protein